MEKMKKHWARKCK